MRIDPVTLISNISRAIEDADNLQSKLPKSVLAIPGMSSARVRCLLNNIVATSPGCNYMEIGCWKGSTLISACYGNTLTSCTAIDNWSQFDGPRDTFFNNVAEYIPGVPLTCRDINCFNLKLDTIKKPIDIYFYDGGHEEEEQYQALKYFFPVLADPCILIIDDWEHGDTIQHGTRRALAELPRTVKHEWQLSRTRLNDTTTWWNGLYIGVL